MQGVTRRRAAGVLALALALAGFLTVVQATPASACPHCDVDTGPNGGSVSVQFSGTAVSGTQGGSSASVPPDCWYEDWLSVEAAFAVRVINEIFGLLFIPMLDLPMGPLAEYKDALEKEPKGEWRWYRLRCRDGISTVDSEQALNVAQTTEWFGRQVARMDLLVGPGTDTPSGVSVQTLLEAAYDAFTVPEPDVTRNPAVASQGDATLVNIDTWFWADNAEESYEITATAGPVSVTLNAVNTGYVLTSPFGSTECTHEQFTTAWSPELDDVEGAGCRIAFDEPSDGAGHEVQISSRWEMSWTATGLAGTQPLNPITPASTVLVPVIEQGGRVTGLG